MAFGRLRLACIQYLVSIWNFTTQISSIFVIQKLLATLYQYCLMAEKVNIEAAVS